MPPDTHPYDLDDLERLATEAVTDVRERTDMGLLEAIGHTSHDFRGREDTMDGQAFEEFQDDLFDELDDLYGVETDDGLRAYMSKRTAYDWSTGEHVKRTGRNSILGGGMLGGLVAGITGNPDIVSDTVEMAQQDPVLGAAGLAGVAGGVAAVDAVTRRIGSGNYLTTQYPLIQHKHRDINISPDEEPAGYTMPVTVSETTHAYQDLWNSPTFSDGVFEEGLDGGAQLAVGDRMQDEYEEFVEDNAWRRAHTLAFTYGRLATDDDEHDLIDPGALEDIGMTPDEAEEAVDVYADHGSSGRNSTAIMGAAALYTAARTEGFDVYAEVFDGDYDRLPEWTPGHGGD